MFILCLKIFFVRILDVSLGTIRTMFVVMCKKLISSIIGFFEILVWFLVVKEALQTESNSIFIAISYSLGFATGNYIGALLSDKLITGNVSVQVFTNNNNLEKILREHPVNKKRVADGKNPATSIWVWGEGTKPQLDNFEEKFGLKGSVISAVDLIKGIAKCAGMNSIDVEGATGNCDTNWEGKAQAALDAILNGSDFVYVHMEAPDEMGHQGAPEKKKFAVETIDKKVVKFLKDELEKRGIDYRMMILPDHPTPIKLKTHVSDPVPYIIYDSTDETDKNANLTYTEENGKKTGIYIEEGYTLMNRFLGK